MVPAAAPPTGWAATVEAEVSDPAPAAPPSSPEVEPGYLTIASAGVIPFSTARVRCITRLVELVAAEAFALEVLAPMNFPVEQVGLGWIE